MTDSEKPTPDEMPSAGRPPAGEPGAGEGPTVRMSHSAPQPADEPARVDPPPAEPPTTPIAVPGRPSGNRADDSDEPTVINAPPSTETGEWAAGGSPQADDEETTSLWGADRDSVPSADRTWPSEWPQPAQWPQAAETPAGHDAGEAGNAGSAPGAAAVDDEPTVERPKPARRPGDDVGGETVRLRPPPIVAPDPPPVTRSEQGQPGASGMEHGRPGASGMKQGQLGASRAEHGPPGASGTEHGQPDVSRMEQSQSGAAGAEQSQSAAAGAEQSQSGGSREDVAGEPAGSLDPVIAGQGGGSGEVRDSAPVPKNDLVRAPDPDGLTVLPETKAGEKGENPVRASWRKLSSASALIWVLLALFGFTLVVQLRSNDTDQGLATARQEDLVRILSDLEARDTRLSAEISTLEQSQRQLTSGVAGRQAALAEADKRADELGLLAGTLPGRGPGLRILIDPKSGTVKASAILNAVQELRGAGGEVMELVGSDGTAVRIVASTYFVDAGGGGIIADGARLTGPYTLWVIGSPQTMQTALQIPGGVVASVESAGGSVTMDQRSLVEVTAVRKATSLQYARPVS